MEAWPMVCMLSMEKMRFAPPAEIEVCQPSNSSKIASAKQANIWRCGILLSSHSHPSFQFNVAEEFNEFRL